MIPELLRYYIIVIVSPLENYQCSALCIYHFSDSYFIFIVNEELYLVHVDRIFELEKYNIIRKVSKV